MKDELAKKQITWIEAKRIASNRVRWRSMVDALFSLLGVKMAQCNVMYCTHSA